MFNKLWNKRRPLVARSGFIFLAILVILILYALRLAFTRSRTEKVIRILCFGDSLTAGTMNVASKSTKLHPYSMKLQQHFDFHDHTVFGRSIRPIFEVHNAGIPGERVVDQMVPRLKQILQRARTNYSWVVILGGTNDLRKYRKDISFIGDYMTILRALEKLHNMTHKYRAKTVAVTIPDQECIGSGTCGALKNTQYKINELLRNFAAHNADKVILADLAREVFLPRDENLWSDWVHFTVKGYDKMADVIYNSMKDHV